MQQVNMLTVALCRFISNVLLQSEKKVCLKAKVECVL